MGKSIRYAGSAPVRLFTAGALIACFPAALVAADVPFTNEVIDSSYYEYADCKSVGDIDGDGLPDVIIGGGLQLNWYRYPVWTKTAIATANVEFTTDMQVGDVDGDGDLDIVVPDGLNGNNVLWFENPRPVGNPATASWTRHEIGATGGFCHDLAVGDLNHDGRLDIVARQQNAATSVFFQNTPTSWTKVTLTAAVDGEGTTVGDIDRDGDLDVVQNGYWLQNPLPGGNPLTGSAWTKRTINGNWPVDVGVATGDMNNDGRLDVVLAHAESTGRMVWYEAPADPINSAWVEHVIDASVDYAHTFKIADINLDGQLDVVFAEMAQSSRKRVGFYLNGGSGLSWQLQVLSTSGSHNIRVADFGNDGDIDIVGANWQGSPIEWWENKLDPGGLSLDSWFYKQVTDQHERTFSLCFPDVNGDGQRDIASGSFVYLNPGAPLTGPWTQVSLPDAVHAFATLDVDGDNLADLIAQQDNPGAGRIDLYWVEASNTAGTAWATPILIGDVPRGSEPEGFQGSAVAQINAGGRPEIIVNSPQGLYYFSVPSSNPGSGNWPHTFIASNNSEEGIGVADLDHDGDLDISFTTGNVNEVKWARNPGDGSGDWAVFTIGTFPEADWPDRCAAADLNGDGRVDIIVTEENSGNSPDALACWWEQPSGGATAANWVRHTITTQYTMNSLDVGDVDQDGDVDLVLAEHRGSKRIAVWANDGQGNFTEHRVDEGKESHLGGRLVDLDNDGDLDLVSIAYDTFNQLHLWRNDSPHNGADTTPPTISNASAVSATTVQVVFSEPVALASAQTLANYSINNGVTISSAVLGADTRTVTLTTSALAVGNYTLTVNNVTDRADPPNPVAPNTQAPFSAAPDSTSPTIASVTAVDSTTVQVLFSEPVEDLSAQTLSNYGIDHGVTLTWAMLGADTRIVKLITSPLPEGNHTLTINNVTDRAIPGNPIAPNSQAAFSFNFTPPSGGITFGSAGSAVDVDGNNNASLVFAQGALTSGYLVVGVSMYDPVAGASITSVTYGGTPMTLLGTIQDANAFSEVYLFGLAVGNKAAGSYTVALTGSTGIDQLMFGVSAFSGVSQTAPTGAFASATGSSTTASVAVSSAAGDVVVDMIGQDVGTSTLGANQTQNWRQEDSTDRADGVSSRETATGATTTMSYQESLASSWSLGAVALKGGGSPPSDITPPTMEMVVARDATTVRVLFSEPVNSISAQTLANYSIDNGVSVSSAVLEVDTRTVTLTTSALMGNLTYTLTVNNVTDLATPANTIAPDAQITFTLPVQAPRLLAIQLNGEGTVTLMLSATPGEQYMLQATSDLTYPVTWENVGTNTAGANGEWTYTDSPTNLKQRFYRVLLLP